eukprot:ANDGO_07099.mRNA.2 hypothetical protein
MKTELTRLREAHDNYEGNANFHQALEELKESKAKLEAECTEKDATIMQLRNSNREFQDQSEKRKHDLLELDKQCSDLKEELAAFRDQEAKIRILRDSEAQKAQDIKSQFALKNKQIDKYLKEINALSASKNDLESQIRSMQQSLIDFEERADRLTEEVRERKLLAQDAEKRIEDLEADKAALIQSTMSLEKRLQTAEQKLVLAVDQYSSEAHTIVDMHEKELKEKEDLISKLREELVRFKEEDARSHSAKVDTRLEQLDRVLAEKNAELEQAYAQIRTSSLSPNSSMTMERSGTKRESPRRKPSLSLAAQSEFQKEAAHLKVDLEIERKRIDRLNKELAEKDERLTNLNQKLTRFEKGIYGMTEAQEEIRELERQMVFRDRDISQLTTQLNLREVDLEEFAEQLHVLRVKYNVPDSDLKPEVLKARNQIEVERLRALKSQLEHEIERTNEELLHWKSVARDRAWESGSRAVKLGLSGDQIMLLDNLADAMRDGNLSGIRGFLKKANEMSVRDHEKLVESEMNQLAVLAKSSSRRQESQPPDVVSRDIDVEYQSRITKLEEENRNLRTILDKVSELKSESRSSRKVSAYQTDRSSVSGTPLQNRMSDARSGDGSLPDLSASHNEDEFRELKIMLDRTNAQLERLSQDNHELRRSVSNIESGGVAIAVESAVSAARELSALKNREKYSLADDVQRELFSVHTKVEEYESEVSRLQKLIHMKDQAISDLTNLTDERLQSMSGEIFELQLALEAAKVKSSEFENMCVLLEDASKNPDETTRKIAEMSRKITLLKVNENVMSKRFVHMNESFQSLTRELLSLKHKFTEQQGKMKERIVFLEEIFHSTEARGVVMEKQIESSVPRLQYEECRIERDYLMRSQATSAAQEAELLDAKVRIDDLVLIVKKSEKEAEDLRVQLRAEKERADRYMQSMEKMSSVSTNAAAAAGASGPQQIAVVTALQVQLAQQQENVRIVEERLSRSREEVVAGDRRCQELQSQIVRLSQQHRETAEREALLEKKLNGCLSAEESAALLRKTELLEKKILELSSENATYKHLAQLSAQMSVQLDSLRAQYDIEIVALNDTVRQLQQTSKSGDESSAILGKLQLQIIQLRKLEIDNARQLESASLENQQQASSLRRLLQLLSEKSAELFRVRQSLRDERRLRLRAEQDLRDAFLVPSSASSLASSTSRRSGSFNRPGQTPAIRSQRWWIELESVHRRNDELKLENGQNVENLDKLKVELHEARTRCEEWAVKYNALSELQLILSAKTDTRDVIRKVVEVSDHLSQSKVSEVRLRRECEFLRDEAKFSSMKLEKTTEALRTAEEELISVETTLEEENRDLKQRVSELEERLLEVDIRHSELVSNELSLSLERLGGRPATTTAAAHDGVADASVIMLQTKLEDIQEKLIRTELLSADLQARLEERDREILQFTRGKSGGVSGKDSDLVGETAEDAHKVVRVAQMTIESLKAQMQKKDDAILRYQELLQLERDNNLSMRQEMQSRMEEFCEKVHIESQESISRLRAAADRPGTNVIDRPYNADAFNPSRGIPPEEVEAMLMDRDKKVSSLQMEADTLRKELHTCRAALEEKNRLLCDVEIQLKKVSEDMPSRTMQRQLSVLKSQLNEKNVQLRNLQAAVDQLRKEIVMVAEDEAKRSMLTSRASATARKEAAVSSSSQNSQPNRGDSDKYLALQQRTEKIKAELDVLRRERDDACASCRLLEESCKRYSEENAKLAMEIAAVTNQNRELRETGAQNMTVDPPNVEPRPVRDVSGRDENGKLEAQYISVKQENDKLLREREDLKKRVSSLESDVTNLKKQLTTVAAMEAFPASVPTSVPASVRAPSPSSVSGPNTVSGLAENPNGPDSKPNASLLARIRWEEEKKVQKQLDGFKQKLKDASVLCSNKEKESEVLQGKVDMLEKKLKESSAELDRVRSELQKASTHVFSGDLLAELAQCKSELFILRESESKLREEIRMRDIRLEHATSEAALPNSDGNSLRLTVDGELLQLRLEKESGALRLERYRQRVQELQALNNMFVQSCSTVSAYPSLSDTIRDLLPQQSKKKVSSKASGIADGSLSSRDPHEMQHVVVALQKVVEKLQKENEELKQHSVSNLKYTEILSQVKIWKKKCLELEGQLKESEEKAASALKIAKQRTDDRLSSAKLQEDVVKLQRLLTLKEEQLTTFGQKQVSNESEILGLRSKLEKAAAELDSLRQDKGRIAEASQTDLAAAVAEIGALRSQLDLSIKKSNSLEESVARMEASLKSSTAEAQRLQTENEDLRRELEAFDVDFFNEIFDLKEKYKSAVEKLRSYGLA